MKIFINVESGFISFPPHAVPVGEHQTHSEKSMWPEVETTQGGDGWESGEKGLGCEIKLVGVRLGENCKRL